MLIVILHAMIFNQNHATVCFSNCNPCFPSRWDEMAKFDLPAMVDYVLNITGQPKLVYIGHSQGTLIGFSQFSQDLQLSKRVSMIWSTGLAQPT